MIATDLHQGVDAVRRFNRFYTRAIGTLEEGLLHTSFSLAEARVLYELANRKQPTAGDIAAELGLDSGYLSRILRGFEQKKLLTRKPSADDGRQTLLGLTKLGRKEVAFLDSASNQSVSELLSPLDSGQRRRLQESMEVIQNLLGGGQRTSEESAPYMLRPHRVGDMGWIVQRHAAIYGQEYGWDERFEALVSRIVADFIDHFDSRRERCWIAERKGEPVGSVFLVKHPEIADTAKLRLLLVEPNARGFGIGRRLVKECTLFARSAGYKRVVLWTNSVLGAARHLYEQEGYRLEHEDPHYSWGKELVGQTWGLEL